MDTQNFLTDKVGSEGLPILNEEDWIAIHSELTKDQFREAIAEWIVTNNPPYPRKISLQNPQKADKRFLELCRKSMSKHIIPKEQTKDVLEKFSDYKRPYSTHGLGVINCGAEFNVISDYPMYEERMKCGSHTSPSPMEKWQDKKELERIFKYFHRLDNKSLLFGKYISAFRLGSYLATQFKPPVAKAIYTMTRAKKILDTSSGWGDRLTGFYTTPKAEEYVGCDPNGDVWKKYPDMCKRYERLLGFKGDPIRYYNSEKFISEGNKKVTIYRLPAEDLPWETFDSDFDCAFTSPPYFATERYGEGGEFEDDQSWKKFSEYESWRDKFFLPVSEWSYKVLKEGGHCMINILDPVVKGKRYNASDDLIDYMEKNYEGSFIGQIGMRYMQRPKKITGEDTKSEDKEYDFEAGGLVRPKAPTAKDRSKDELDKFMAKCYIENIWCFRKGEEKYPLFNRDLLEKFFT